MSSSAVDKPPPKEVGRVDDSAGVLQESETSAKASANAGLNLNIFGAISAAFSGKNRKVTEVDGSSVESREENAAISGVGMGRANVQANADAEQHGRQMRAAIREQDGRD